MISKRQERFDDFNNFFENCKERFEKFAVQNNSNDLLDKNYILSIAPGKRFGGTDRRTIEVFYGCREFDIIPDKDSWISNTEWGATLIYQQHDDGLLTIMFVPAQTKRFKQKEDFIIYKVMENTKLLEKYKFIQKHFDLLVAYMQVTCLLGSPNLWQKYSIWKMRFFKKLIIKNEIQESKFAKIGSNIFQFVLTIGFSGFIFSLINLMSSYKEKKPEIKRSIELQDTLREFQIRNYFLLDSINATLKRIEAKKIYYLKTRK